MKKVYFNFYVLFLSPIALIFLIMAIVLREDSIGKWSMLALFFSVVLISYFLEFRFFVFGEKKITTLFPTRWKKIYYSELKYCYLCVNRTLIARGGAAEHKKTYIDNGTKKFETCFIPTMVFLKEQLDEQATLEYKSHDKNLIICSFTLKCKMPKNYLLDLPFGIRNAKKILSKFQGAIYTNEYFAIRFAKEIEFLSHEYNVNFEVLKP